MTYNNAIVQRLRIFILLFRGLLLSGWLSLGFLITGTAQTYTRRVIYGFQFREKTENIPRTKWFGFLAMLDCAFSL